MARYEVDREAVRAWVEETCAEQGLPVKIDDPATIKFVAGLILQQREETKRAQRRRA